MTFDFQQPSMAGGIIVFPDAPYAQQPKPPGAIKENVIIRGTSNTAVTVTGTADQKE